MVAVVEQDTVSPGRAVVRTRAVEARILAAYGALAFPPVLMLGSWLLDGRAFRQSLSAYYHSGMKPIFTVGVMAIGLLLFAFRVGRRDGRRFRTTVGAVGLVAATVVAYVPAVPEGQDKWSQQSVVHGVAAAVLFGCMTAMAGYLWARPADPRPLFGDPTGVRPKRYRALNLACFIVMIGAMLGALGMTVMVHRGWQPQWNLLLWMEIPALWAFAIAFLTQHAPEREPAQVR
jgi:hypothetical protein